MLIGGEKWACDSCVKGHRVSNCNHSDRPLNHIAPKGRPVKQCEHCRDARKSKSHHAKCDCGSKRTKEKKQSEIKSEDHGCCCQKGADCVCSNKTELQELRLETSLSRPTHAVKSKPKLSSGNSETALTVFANGHHKPVHRNNNMAHTSGAPYKIPRPHTLHGITSFAQATYRTANNDVIGRSADDLMLLNSANSNRFYESVGNAPASADNLQLQVASRDMTAFRFDNLLANSSHATENVSRDELRPSSGTGMGWFDTPLMSVAEAPGDFTTSPVFGSMPEIDWNIPSATTDFFSPSDLPLVSNAPLLEFAQPISHSGESNYQSAPGLTAPSSGTQSEIGEMVFPVDAESSAGFWTDSVAFRDPEPYRMSSASIYDNFSFSQSNGAEAKPLENSTYFNFENIPTSYAPSLGDGTAVSGDASGNPDGLPRFTTRELTGKGERSVEYSNTATERSIMIPAGVDDDGTDSWYYPTSSAANTAEPSREYSWLLDDA